MKQIIGLAMIALLIFSCAEDKKVTIGKWVDTSSHGEAVISIYQKGNTFYLENWYQGRSGGSEELTTEEVDGQVRHIQEEDGQPEKYYVIDSRKVLRIYTEYGLVATLRSTE